MKKFVPPRFVLYFFIADLIVVLMYHVNSVIGYISWRIHTFFELGLERNLSTWYCAAKLILIGLFWSILIHDNFGRQGKTSRLLRVIPLVFFVLSLDQVAEMHEWFRFRIARSTWYTITSIGLVIFAILLSWVGHRNVGQHTPARSRFITGTILLLFTMVGVQAFDTSIIPRAIAGDLSLSIISLLQMVGVTFFLWGTYDVFAACKVSTTATWRGTIQSDASIPSHLH